VRAMLARLRKRLSMRGPAGQAMPIDWASIDSYSELHETVWRARFPDQRAFLEGPLERYLQLVEASPGRVGARIMEHLGAALRGFRGREAAEGRSTDWFDKEADAMVRGRFGGGSDNDLYMIEVFEGRATHNYRASNDPEDEP
jgi:hypothetical protein